MSKISFENFEKIYEVFQLLNTLPKIYGENYSYELLKYFRKNEYVFGVNLSCNLGGNLEIKDYVSVLFNDSEKNEVEGSDFTEMIEGIKAFQEKVNKLKQ